MTPKITKAVDPMPVYRDPHYQIDVGQYINASMTNRTTTVRVRSVDVAITENKFDKFGSPNEYVWQVCFEPHPATGTDNREDVIKYMVDNIRICKALGFLDYEFVDKEDEVLLWEKPVAES